MVSKLIDEKIWMSNLLSFINDHLMAKFKKNSAKSIDKLIVCKEDKEHITKTRMVLITELFRYLLALDEKSLK